MTDLSTLRDIHLPPEPSFWPPAIGWWLLGLTIIALIGFAPALRRAFQRFIVRQRLLHQSRQLQRQMKQSTDAKTASRVLADMSQLVRTVAHSRMKPAYKSTLTGDHWLAFLTDTSDGVDFSQSPGHWLADAPYHREMALDQDASKKLMTLCRQWIKRHA